MELNHDGIDNLAMSVRPLERVNHPRRTERRLGA